MQVKEFAKDFLRAFRSIMPTHQDTWRIIVCMALACILFYPDLSNMKIVGVVAGFFIAVGAITHVTRIILFPYIHLEHFTTKAKEEPLAASIVVFSICMVIAVMIWASASFFR